MSPSNPHHRQANNSRARPPEEEEKFEYGSREADQAAKQLQDLGAMVYPPGNKDTIDWGMLAGITPDRPHEVLSSFLTFDFDEAVHVTSVTAHA